jgi:hypothetical protein
MDWKMDRVTRRRFLTLTAAQAGVVVAAGCGTIMYPERIGQPTGPLDWKVVALDTIGLLFFFVPGVIAFAVDFTNGTIYLPPEHYGLKTPPEGKQLVEVKVPDKRITVAKLEQVVSEHSQQDVVLQPGSYQTEPLQNIDQFWTTAGKHQTPEQQATYSPQQPRQ